jgi:phage FluMu protein Com
MPNHVHHHFRSLDIAREALDLGARRTVVQQITGLCEGELRRVFGACPSLTTNWGGRPSSVEKLVQGRQLHMHASDFYNGFHHLLSRGVPPDEAMVVAYRHYKDRHPGDARLGFDRAFSVVTSVCRLWTSAAPSLKPLRCRTCGARYLAPIGASAHDETPCTYCRVARRVARDGRASDQEQQCHQRQRAGHQPSAMPAASRTSARSDCPASVA